MCFIETSIKIEKNEKKTSFFQSKFFEKSPNRFLAFWTLFCFWVFLAFFVHVAKIHSKIKNV
jgi:hypothetical protein